MNWFDSLNKPFLNPPDFIFAPVWAILYFMMALSFIFFIKGNFSKKKILPLVLFIIQLALNLIWTPIFFGMKNISFALLVIVLLWFFILFTIISFFKYSKTASLLLIPYLIWVSFAAYLNFSFYLLN